MRLPSPQLGGPGFGGQAPRQFGQPNQAIGQWQKGITVNAGSNTYDYSGGAEGQEWTRLNELFKEPTQSKTMPDGTYFQRLAAWKRLKSERWLEWDKYQGLNQNADIQGTPAWNTARSGGGDQQQGLGGNPQGGLQPPQQQGGGLLGQFPLLGQLDQFQEQQGGGNVGQGGYQAPISKKIRDPNQLWYEDKWIDNPNYVDRNAQPEPEPFDTSNWQQYPRGGGQFPQGLQQQGGVGGGLQGANQLSSPPMGLQFQRRPSQQRRVLGGTAPSMGPAYGGTPVNIRSPRLNRTADGRILQTLRGQTDPQNQLRRGGMGAVSSIRPALNPPRWDPMKVQQGKQRRAGIGVAGGGLGGGGGRGRNWRGRGRTGGLAENLYNEFQQAMDEANEANEARYQQGLQGYQDRFSRGMGYVDQYGAGERTDLRQQFKNLEGTQLQDLAGRGLLNSSTNMAMALGRGREEANANLRLEDKIARMKMDQDSKLSGDLLRFLESKKESGPDYNMLANLATQIGRRDEGNRRRDLYGGYGYGGQGFGGGGGLGIGGSGWFGANSLFQGPGAFQRQFFGGGRDGGPWKMRPEAVRALQQRARNRRRFLGMEIV